MQIFYDLFGHSKDLNSLQMGCRAFVMFFITLVLIRLSGMRAFGNKSAFDNIIVIMLGAILSRAVAGVSPFVPIVVSGTVIALIHRLLAMLSVHFPGLSKLIKSESHILYRNGKYNRRNMAQCNISEGDLLEGIRLAGSVASAEEVKEIYMERNGEISVVK